MQTTTAASTGASHHSNSSLCGVYTVAMQLIVTHTRVLQSSTPDTRPAQPTQYMRDAYCCPQPGAQPRLYVRQMCESSSNTLHISSHVFSSLWMHSATTHHHHIKTTDGPTACCTASFAPTHSQALQTVAVWPASKRCHAKQTRGQQQHRHPPHTPPSCRDIRAELP